MVQRSILRKIFDFWLEKLSFRVHKRKHERKWRARCRPPPPVFSFFDKADVCTFVRVPMPSFPSLLFRWPFVVSWRLNSALLKKWKLRRRLLTLFSYGFFFFQNLPYCKQIPECSSSFRLFRIRSHPRRCSTPSVDESRKRNKEKHQSPSASSYFHTFTSVDDSYLFNFTKTNSDGTKSRTSKSHTISGANQHILPLFNCLPQTDVCASSNVLEAVSNGKAHTRRSETAIRVAN